MRALRRIIRAWNNSLRAEDILSDHSLSRDVVFLNRWRPDQDLVHAFPVCILLEFLQACWRSVLPLPLGLYATIEQMQLNVLEITVLEARQLSVLQSQIIALMGRPDSPNPAFWQNTYSLQDVTLVSNPVDWVRGLFPLKNCRVNAFIRSPNLRGLFFSQLEYACLFPQEFFDNIGVERFLVDALARRSRNGRTFFSLSFVLVWFISFFIRFSARCSLSEEVQKEILMVIFEDLCTRLDIFNVADMALFLLRGIVHLTGNVCAACIPIAWENNLPVVLQEALLESGDSMYDCLPIDEACVLSVFRRHFSEPMQYWYADTQLYGDAGRRPDFLDFSPQAIIGHLDTSVVWRTWRSTYFSILASLFPSTNLRTPGSLVNCAARSIVVDVCQGRLSMAPSEAIAVWNQGAFFLAYEVDSLHLRCACLKNNQNVLRLFSSRMHTERMFLESIQTFLATPEISCNSSEEELEQCSRLFVLIMRQVPFCRYPFFQAACLSYIVEYLINNLLGIASCLPENRQRVLSLGSRRMARYFWRLVSHACLDLEQGPLVSNENRIRFLRTCFVLYDRYFVRRRPFSQEESNDEE